MRGLLAEECVIRDLWIYLDAALAPLLIIRFPVPVLVIRSMYTAIELTQEKQTMEKREIQSVHHPKKAGFWVTDVCSCADMDWPVSRQLRQA